MKTFNCSYNGNTVSVVAESEMDAKAKAYDELHEGNGFLDLSAIEIEEAGRTILTKQEAFELGRDHGNEMANESGSSDAGCDGWDGMLINANPSFAREKFGWDGCDSSDEAKELLAEYCRGCQAGADAAIEE